MTEEARKKLEAIFDPQNEYPVLKKVIEPERIVCPDCGGITFDGLELCHLCGGMLINLPDRKEED